MSDQARLSIQNTKGPIEGAADLKVIQGQEGQWMTLHEASQAVELSLGTLRRYIKRRKLKYRRLGKTTNSKIQVLITPEFLKAASEDIDNSVEEFGSTEAENVDEIIEASDIDVYSDQSTQETMIWFRERLDDKDAQIKELMHQLMSASHRNGYLESQVKEFDEKIKLLTDSETASKRKSWWTRFRLWIAGIKADDVRE